MGLARTELELNSLFASQWSLQQSVIFLIALLALFFLNSSSVATTEVMLAVLFAGSPLVLVAVAARVCPHCIPDGTDWIAVPVGIGSVILSGSLLARHFVVSRKYLYFVAASALMMLLGQLALIVAIPKFCPICLFLGALLQAVLFNSERAVVTSELRGVTFGGPRPVLTMISVGLVAASLAWVRSPSPRVSHDETLRDVQAALSHSVRRQNGVLILTQEGCGPCEEAKAYIRELVLAIENVPMATSLNPAGWNPSAHIATPTFVLVKNGQPTDYMVGFPTDEGDRRQLLKMISVANGASR